MKNKLINRNKFTKKKFIKDIFDLFEYVLPVLISSYLILGWLQGGGKHSFYHYYTDNLNLTLTIALTISISIIILIVLYKYW